MNLCIKLINGNMIVMIIIITNGILLLYDLNSNLKSLFSIHRINTIAIQRLYNVTGSNTAMQCIANTPNCNDDNTSESELVDINDI